MSDTYSLEEAAAQICGADAAGNPLPGKVEWLAKRLRSGEIAGYKVSRKWRMSDEQIDAAIDALTPKPFQLPAVPTLAGLTRTSRRRLSA